MALRCDVRLLILDNCRQMGMPLLDYFRFGIPERVAVIAADWGEDRDFGGYRRDIIN
jgi:hypothetical protein